MDGEGRSHFQQRPSVMCPKCYGEVDSWRHWMFRCPHTEGVRKEGWEKLKIQLRGGWVDSLSEGTKACLVAGRMPREVGEAVSRGHRVGGPGDTQQEELTRVQAAFVRWGAKMMEVRRSWGGVGMWHAAEMAELEAQCAECGGHTECETMEDGEEVCPRCIREGQLEEWAARILRCTRCGEGVPEDEEEQLCTVCRVRAGEGEEGGYGQTGEEEEWEEGSEQQEGACPVCGQHGPPGGGVCPLCEGSPGEGQARPGRERDSAKRARADEGAGQGEGGAKSRRGEAAGGERRPAARCTRSCKLTAHCGQDREDDGIDGCEKDCDRCCKKIAGAACARSCELCCVALCKGRCPRHCKH
jgi:hypothetical protein